jgi:uncharacterized DUF497 family protein
MGLEYDWDEDKNRKNKVKHGVSFEEAEEALLRSDRQDFDFDEEHSKEYEDRFIYWVPKDFRWLRVSVAYRKEEKLRIISARFEPIGNERST